MSRRTRREFLGQSLAGAAFAGFAIGGTKSSGRIIGANDAIRLGVAGLNGRGGSHVGEFGPMNGVDITYLIDPDAKTYDKRIKQLEKAKPGAKPRTIKDVREALDDKNLDAISIATPNHWHALMTIWGCQAGKDVYVEKPCSHNIHEGKIAVEAARKYGRIVQHGTQSRSMPKWAETAALVKSGKYGKLLVSRALCYKPRWEKPNGNIGFKADGPAPATLDFNIWTGPASEHAYNGNYVHYNWHWFWDFGNGDIGNQGVHEMDIARWMIPGATTPKTAISLGGRFGYKDQGQTANTQIALFDFGETQLIFEVRGLKTEDYMGQKIGNILHLEAGTIAGGKFTPKGSTKAESLAKVEGVTRGPGKGHFGNFIAAVRSRKTEDLNADILEGRHSAALCHLANISYRLGHPVDFISSTPPFGDCAAGAETFERMKQHLTVENGLNLADQPYQLGAHLAIDAKGEGFLDAPPGAEKLLTRNYRKPFVVPESIG